MTARPDYRFPRSGPLPGQWTVAGGLLCLLPATLGALATIFGVLPADTTAFIADANAAPSWRLWLGADALGRDLFSRLAAASVLFLGPGVVAAVVAAVAGVALGVGRSLGGRLLGPLSSWMLQVLDGVPKLVLVLLVAAIARSDLGWIMATVGLTFAPQIAEAVASSVERLRSSAFIEAELSLGVGIGRIVFVHILWGHARRVLLSQLTSLFAYALLVESTLSYLGGELGVQEPTPSWGNMLALAREGFFHGHLFQALAPAAMIAVTLLGFSTLAAGLLQSLEGRR
jgi:peptide/nickel transport system permease protein